MSEKSVVKATLSFIEENLDEDLSLNRIAESLCYSKFYINRLFSKEMGCTIHPMQPGIAMSGSNHSMKNIYSRLLSDRIIFLSEEVNDLSAGRKVAQLLFLDAEDTEKDIQLYINSPGGSVTAGFAIYDTMRHFCSLEAPGGSGGRCRMRKS